jgi:hypothetical protein
VAVVDHDERAVGIGEAADIGKLGEIAVHGKNAVGDDDDAAGVGFAGGFELRFEIIHVAIGVAVARRLGEPHAVDDRGVVEAVRNDRVHVAEQRLEQAAIGVETGGVEDGVLHADIGSDF